MLNGKQFQKNTEFKMITSTWYVNLLIILGGLAFLGYKFLTRKFKYWKQRDVTYLEPLPFFGNAWDIFFFKKNMGEWFKDIYDSVDKSYFGIFVLDEPAFVLKCPKLIKQIMVRDFNYFSDRTVAAPKHNGVIANMMFMQKNPEWKTIRTKMTPAFSSGKLKSMLPLIKPIADDLVTYISKRQGVQEAKEICSKFTIEVISVCGFGINAHCFEDDNAVFRKIGKAMFDFSWRNGIAQVTSFFKPSWVNWFKLDFFERWICDYLTDVLRTTIKTREETKIKANDIVDILADLLKKKDALNLDDVQITAQATQFFAAGFETTASTIAHAIYELAMNQEVQEKLREEINSTLQSSRELSYETLMNMKYLDLVMLETLRKYPVVPFLERKCMKDYSFPDTNFVIEKGISIYMPMLGLHHEEKYFPEPMKFIPERFTENINAIADGLVYMPFGYGPRSCIGERFGLISAKIAVVYMLANYEIQRCPLTPEPIEFEAKTFTIQSKVGIPLIFQKIVHNSPII